ncbi:MAG: peptidoglycan glycosyltransferase/peptidoglycan DD-transpeptidase MrcA [Plesiomonas sp.]|uniref:peptidoglycan glycosyltransferase/peptidoglycan DD-transpeptidase MrcA n=1 Tax=Plesiomonas sp. TaxID=2486279 RepID=UPI003F3F0C29
MKLIKYFFVVALSCILLGGASVYGLYVYVKPQLPDVATLRDVRLQTPMQVYSADGKLISQFGEKRRIPLTLEQIPPQLVNAFIATEDSRFYQHDGIDPIGMLRAAFVSLTAGHAKQGASTITQQLARNFFLSPEKTIMRKVKEVFLALRIEQLLTKDEILNLYLNKIYLGYRAYGVGAAARVYFGKDVDQLTLSEMAVIAGLPKAPSTLNPLYSLSRSENRRNVVLSRMLEEHYITQSQYQETIKQPIVASYHGAEIELNAPYLAEMVRQEMFNRFGESAYTDGFKVYTTVDSNIQAAADNALQNNVIAYDMRHGYRGPANQLWTNDQPAWDTNKIVNSLKNLPTYGPFQAAVVTAVQNQSATAVLGNGQSITLNWDGMKWARPFISDTRQGPSPKNAHTILNTGEQIWVRSLDDVWWLGQVPDVNSALVSLNPENGAVKALVGGFSYNQSKFNRVTQSIRQVGSNIKPFIYAAALEKGFSLATILNDAPITRWDSGAGSNWRPKNSPAVYDGPLRLRVGLGLSKNVMMVRALRAIGVNFAADFLERFGFNPANISRYDSLALGAADFTPLALARGYSVFANGGYLITPYFISKIEYSNGKLLEEAKPLVACTNNCNAPVVYGATTKAAVLNNALTEDLPPQDSTVPMPQIEHIDTPLLEQKEASEGYAPHVISSQLAFLIRDALESAIWGEPGAGWQGTGWRAAKLLKRHDIGGKTGTTNNSKDAWYSGYGPNTVTTVWVGFDDHRRELGRSTQNPNLSSQTISGYEGGAKSAQPAWNAFMQAALNGIPEQPKQIPEGILSIPIDMKTGKLADGSGRSRVEYFIPGTQPTEQPTREVGTTVIDNSGTKEELF